MTKNVKIAFVAGCIAAILGFWFVRAKCFEDAPMRVRVSPQDYAPQCGCLGKNIIVSDHWAADGERVFLCIGIPK